MTEYPIDRRQFLQVSAIGAVSATGLGQLPVEAKTPDERWRFQTGNAVHAPTIKDGVVYVGGEDFYAIDAADGEQRWQFELDDRTSSAAMVVDGTAYVSTLGGTLYAIDTYAGEKIWQADIGHRSESSPYVYDETVYVGSRTNGVFAFHASDGSERWHVPMEGNLPASPTVVDGTVFIGSYGEQMFYALDAADGSVRWQRAGAEHDGRFSASATVDDDVVYTGDFEGTLYAFDTTDGSEIWRRTTDSRFEGTPTVADGTVYAINRYDYLFAFNATDGSTEWRISTGGRRSPTVVEDMVIVPAYDVLAVDAADGSEGWRLENTTGFDGPPIVVDGTLYAGNVDGHVYAFDLAVDGSSRGSRVRLGTLGHHDDWIHGTGSELSIDQTSVQLDRYAVERGGDHPRVELSVQNAESVRLDVDTLSSPVEMQQSGETDTWTATIPGPADPPPAGTHVTFEIVAEGKKDQRETVSTYPEPVQQEGVDRVTTDLGYYIFEEVWDVGVLFGQFNGQQIPTEYRDVDTREAWITARELDINHYFASSRGLYGRIGFDFTVNNNSDDLYSLSETHQEYQNRRRGWAAIEDFGNELADAANFDIDQSPAQFWVGTHPAGTIGNSDIPGFDIDSAGKYTHEMRYVYVPHAFDASSFGAAVDLGTWIHEFCHALGYAHVTGAGHEGQKDVMDARSRNRWGLDQTRTPPIGTPLKLAETLGFKLRSTTQYGDFFDGQTTDLGGPIQSGTAVVTDLTDMDQGDPIQLLSHPTPPYKIGEDTFVVEYRERLQEWDDTTDENVWGSGNGSVVVCRHDPNLHGTPGYEALATQSQTYLSKPGDELVAQVSGADYEIVFTLDGFGQTEGTNVSTIRYAKRVPNGTRVVLSGAISIPDRISLGNGREGLRPPSLHMLVEDGQGRRVGVTEEGEFVSEIPGVRSSGKRIGDEWIVLPDGIDPTVTVSSHEVREFVKEAEAVGAVSTESGEELMSETPAEYGVRVTEYGDDAILEESGEYVGVTNADARVAEGTLSPGTTYAIADDDYVQEPGYVVGSAGSGDGLPDWLPIAGGAGLLGSGYAGYRYLTKNDDSEEM